MSAERISRNWPNYFSSGQNDPVPADLIGATILEFGQPLDLKLEGGGLSIVYIPNGSSESKRIDISFTELGMWIAEDA